MYMDYENFFIHLHHFKIYRLLPIVLVHWDAQLSEGYLTVQQDIPSKSH